MDFQSMDFSNPNFTDLLNTQTQTDLLNTQTQTDHLNTQTQTDLLNNQTQSKHRWTVPEEKVLVSSWLNTSKDAVVSNEQKAGKFWKRVAELYPASPAVADLPKREPNTCKQKWGKISESVSKFSGCFEYANRHKRSGQNEDDLMELAYQVYFQDQKMKFTLEHAWRLLRNDQKWCTFLTEKGASCCKRAKVSEGGGFTSSSNNGCHVEEEIEERPLGVKASKAKEKKRSKGESEETDARSLKVFEEVWVMKKEDLAMKERLSNQKILECLMKKTEPLTELELNLKDKLIMAMCNHLG